jgi:hypothetical protein
LPQLRYFGYRKADGRHWRLRVDGGQIRPSRTIRPRRRSAHWMKRTAVAAPRLSERDDELGRVLRQRRDTPGNEEWSGRWESNPRLKLGKLGYYHYTTPASGSDSMRLATYQANRRPDKGKAPCGALPIVQVSIDFALVELVVRRELQSTSEDSLEIRGGPWRVVAARAGDRRERRLLVEHVVDNEPHLELGVEFHADG